MTNGNDRKVHRDNMKAVRSCPNELKDNFTALLIWPKIKECKYPCVQWLEDCRGTREAFEEWTVERNTLKQEIELHDLPFNSEHSWPPMASIDLSFVEYAFRKLGWTYPAASRCNMGELNKEMVYYDLNSKDKLNDWYKKHCSRYMSTQDNTEVRGPIMYFSCLHDNHEQFWTTLNFHRANFSKMIEMSDGGIRQSALFYMKINYYVRELMEELTQTDSCPIENCLKCSTDQSEYSFEPHHFCQEGKFYHTRRCESVLMRQGMQTTFLASIASSLANGLQTSDRPNEVNSSRVDLQSITDEALYTIDKLCPNLNVKNENIRKREEKENIKSSFKPFETDTKKNPKKQTDTEIEANLRGMFLR